VKPSYDLHGDPLAPSHCLHCGKSTSPAHNFCDMECHVAAARAEGAREHRPNGLPITCIQNGRDGILLLEHSYADLPDYRFPVEVEWIGPEEHDHFTGTDGSGTTSRLPEHTVAAMKRESHALLFTDGVAAVTIEDDLYALWYLNDGRCGGGSCRDAKVWQMTERSREKARLDKSREVRKPPVRVADIEGLGDPPPHWQGAELLYTDGYVALTAVAGEKYALWSVKNGLCLAGRDVWNPKQWRLSPETCAACKTARERDARSS